MIDARGIGRTAVAHQRRHGRRFARRLPTGIARQDQRGNLAGMARCSLHCGSRIPRDRSRAVDPAHPVRQGSGQSFDIGCQRRIVLQVLAGMFADHVDHARRGTFGIVDIGKTIGETRTEMEQGRSGPIGHPVPAIGSTGGDAFEQAQHRFHRRIVERGQKMHFRRPGVGKANVDAQPGQCGYERLSAVLGFAGHDQYPASSRPWPTTPYDRDGADIRKR